MRYYFNNSVLKYYFKEILEYKSPINLNYTWNFGFIASFLLLIQIITGIFLAMNYVGSGEAAFLSLEHIMRDVPYGWIIKTIHANGASIFFLIIYFHILRSIYNSSYYAPRNYTWRLGVSLFFLMIITAFLGYVLPMGQMSFWAATVITNLLTIVPFIGDNLVHTIWGSFAVSTVTLTRFFILHFIFPFLLGIIAILHLLSLHEVISNNPLSLDHFEKRRFFSIFLIKDFLSLLIIFEFFLYFIFFNPNYLGHPDNYIQANPLQTPPHIVPEWYFLIFYSMLRSIPNKILGILCLFLSIFCLYLFSIINDIQIKSLLYKPLDIIIFGFFIITCLDLATIGVEAVNQQTILDGQIGSFNYFLFIIINILPREYQLLKFFINTKHMNKKNLKLIKYDII